MPSDFKTKVIEIVNKIPEGRVTTYGTVAVLAGVPRGARLVGGVLNYHSEELPWQRVINREGYLSIKCLCHPKQLQKALLVAEGVKVTDGFIVDLEKYGWFGD